MLAHLLRETRDDDTPRTVALGLVTAGAIGNLIDRLRSDRGVIDFIDVGVEGWRFWTFNVADIGVSCGAVLLAIVLWREERSRHTQPAAAAPTPTQPPQSSTT
jgi:signal peptidase II